MQKFIVGIIFLLIISCVKNETKNNHEINTISHIKFDNLIGEGYFLKEDFPIGYWKYYDSENQLMEVKEFLNIDDTPYLNQNWTFDKNGDTIPELSYYYKIIFEKDTLSFDEPLKAIVNLKEEIFKDYSSSIMVVLPQKNSENFNIDFSNVEQVEKDTIFNLNIEKNYREQGSLEGDYRRSVFLGWYFDTIGLKKIRGIIVEYNFDGKPLDTLKSKRNEHYYYYFEKEIFVKE